MFFDFGCAHYASSLMPWIDRMSKRIYIAVAGNIGAGKSTLVDFLCKTYGIQAFFEPNEDNPYLPDFYQDMEKWSFHSQLYFLSHKFKIHQELDQTSGVLVQDRTIFEDSEIFAKALYLQKKMTERDFQTYQNFYQTICHTLRAPDLMIYLRSPIRTLKKRIRSRGRAMESNIPDEYLRLLHELYEQWIKKYTMSEVLVLDTNKLDYMSNLVDKLDVFEKIEAYLPKECIEYRHRNR